MAMIYDPYTKTLRQEDSMFSPTTTMPDNGDFLVHRANGRETYIPFVAELPDVPSDDGTYTLTCTVDDGAATLSWEAAAEAAEET